MAYVRFSLSFSFRKLPALILHLDPAISPFLHVSIMIADTIDSRGLLYGPRLVFMIMSNQQDSGNNGRVVAKKA